VSPHDAVRVPAIRRWTLAALLAVIPTCFSSTATARVDLCGTTIVTDFTLDQDLNCTGNALIIGADGITIDLQRHTIAGTGTGAGLAISGRTGVRIVGGIFVNYAAGILVSSSSDIEIEHGTFRDNTDGIDLQAGSTGITIKQNKFLNNRARGIMNRSGTSDNEIKENAFVGNRVGILLFGPIGITVTENSVSGSLQFGLRVNFPATGNLIKENTITSNPIGIDFIPNPMGGAGAAGNSFVENTISSNGCGLNGPMSGNTFQENQLIGNAQDVCG
jgi:parallel beta-helix repeat protein